MTRRNEKILFSLEGVDLNDDAAIEEFARQVWEQAVSAFGANGRDVEGPLAIDDAEARTEEDSGE